MEYRVLRPCVVVIEMITGEVLESIDIEEEGDVKLVWWSDRCSCFHWAYNGYFRGVYTGSFANLREKEGAEPCYRREVGI
jgi:hypothetical protein